MLWINDLSKLKFTSIRPHAIHFKYDGEDYFIHAWWEDGDSGINLYKGRCKSPRNKFLRGSYGDYLSDFIKYDYNRRTLSSINKFIFVSKLYSCELIETNISEIKYLVSEGHELKNLIIEQESKLRDISRMLNRLL